MTKINMNVNETQLTKPNAWLQKLNLFTRKTSSDDLPTDKHVLMPMVIAITVSLFAILYLIGLAQSLQQELQPGYQPTTTKQTQLKAPSKQAITDSTSPSTKEKTGLTQQDSEIIKRFFNQKFIGGDWYFQGLEEVGNTVLAYIQIPQKQNLSAEQLKNYMLKSICPSNNYRSLWRQLTGKQLQIHLYSVHKGQSQHATCGQPA